MLQQLIDSRHFEELAVYDEVWGLERHEELERQQMLSDVEAEQAFRHGR